MGSGLSDLAAAPTTASAPNQKDNSRTQLIVGITFLVVAAASLALFAQSPDCPGCKPKTICIGKDCTPCPNPLDYTDPDCPCPNPPDPLHPKCRRPPPTPGPLPLAGAAAALASARRLRRRLRPIPLPSLGST